MTFCIIFGQFSLIQTHYALFMSHKIQKQFTFLHSVYRFPVFLFGMDIFIQETLHMQLSFRASSSTWLCLLAGSLSFWIFSHFFPDTLSIYILFRSLFARYLHAAPWKLMLLALAVSGIPPRMSFFLKTLSWYLSDKLTGLQYYGQRSLLVLEFLIRLKLNINLSTWWVIRACSCSCVRCNPRPGSQIMKRQSPINRLSLYITLRSLWLS